jgi:hypothetical protein
VRRREEETTDENTDIEQLPEEAAGVTMAWPIGRCEWRVSPFKEGDFTDPVQLAARLRVGRDRLSRYLREGLYDKPDNRPGLHLPTHFEPDEKMRKLPFDSMESTLSIAFSRIVRRGKLYDGRLFGRVKLTKETQRLLQQSQRAET